MADNPESSSIHEEWERTLLAIPLFADLPKPSFKKLVEECTSSVVRKDATIFEQEEYTADVYVVLSGLVGAYRANSRGGHDYIMSLGTNEWFGEISALSNAPREITVLAETRSVLLRIPRATFVEIYRAKAAQKLRDQIDALYKERVLRVLLQSISLFRGLSPRVLQEIALSAIFERAEPGGKVVVEDDDGKDFFVVRSGNLKVTREKDGRAELLAYLSDNAYFGEIALIREVKRQSTVEALTQCDLVRIPGDAFQAMLSNDARVRELIHERVKNLYSQEFQDDDARGNKALELLVQHEVLKGGEALVIDTTKCTHCNMCITGCIEAHDDRIPRIGKRGMEYDELLLTSSCYNCTVPECMLACKFGAIRRSRDGQVHIDPYACTGCTLCEPACPYGTIHMQSLLGETVQKQRPAWLEKIMTFPLLHQLIAEKADAEAASVVEADAEHNPKLKKAPKALAVKCDFCAGRGEMACIYNCPCGAIDRIDPRVLLRK